MAENQNVKKILLLFIKFYVEIGIKKILSKNIT